MTSAALVVAIGALLARGLHQVAQARTLNDARQEAEVVAGVGIQPELGKQNLWQPLDGELRARLDTAVATAKARHQLSRVKIWRNDGKVLYYSDNPALELSKAVTPSDEAREAFKGKTESEISNLDKPENRFDRGLGKSLEVYVPLEVGGKLQGAFEIYIPYKPIDAAIMRDTRQLSLLLLVGLALLWAGLFRIVVGASRRLRHQAAANKYLALHDQLTGLPNRTQFRDATAAALDAVGPQRNVAVMLLDIDRFKEVNDTLGHETGDVLLRDVGARLGSVLRDTDVVARLGGDEFAVLLPAVTDVDAAAAVARKLVDALDQPFAIGRIGLTVDVSVGIAIGSAIDVDADGLLQQADVAMYASKDRQAGPVVYAPELDEYDPDRLTLVSELRRAIDNDELLIHFQPKVALPTREVVGVEALVRWEHPERGLVPPNEFIPLAERTGLIAGITDRVLEGALRQCASWRRRGLRLPVSVNLSARSLHDEQVPDRVAAALAAWDLPADALELEITESTLMAQPTVAVVVLDRLAAMGIGLSVDDFGTGYSSLAYLKQLPVNELKIDKSFVLDLADDEGDAAIVRSTIDLGHSLGLRVVAEGVETPAAWDRLRELGCDVAQGYLMARPMPGPKVRRWISTWQRSALPRRGRNRTVKASA